MNPSALLKNQLLLMYFIPPRYIPRINIWGYSFAIPSAIVILGRCTLSATGPFCNPPPRFSTTFGIWRCYYFTFCCLPSIRPSQFFSVLLLQETQSQVTSVAEFRSTQHCIRTPPVRVVSSLSSRVKPFPGHFANPPVQTHLMSI